MLIITATKNEIKDNLRITNINSSLRYNQIISRFGIIFIQGTILLDTANPISKHIAFSCSWITIDSGTIHFITADSTPPTHHLPTHLLNKSPPADTGRGQLNAALASDRCWLLQCEYLLDRLCVIEIFKVWLSQDFISYNSLYQ